MYSGQDRVILIEGDSSNWYEQAIFIVKASLPKNKMPVDLVAEAEKIINGHGISRTSGTSASTSPIVASKPKASKTTVAPIAVQPATKKKNPKFNFFLNLFMLMSCLALLGLLTMMMR